MIGHERGGSLENGGWSKRTGPNGDRMQAVSNSGGRPAHSDCMDAVTCHGLETARGWSCTTCWLKEGTAPQRKELLTCGLKSGTALCRRNARIEERTDGAKVAPVRLRSFIFGRLSPLTFRYPTPQCTLSLGRGRGSARSSALWARRHNTLFPTTWLYSWLFRLRRFAEKSRDWKLVSTRTAGDAGTSERR